MERQLKDWGCFLKYRYSPFWDSICLAPEVLVLARENYNSFHSKVVVGHRHRRLSTVSWTLCGFHTIPCWKVEVWSLTKSPRAPRSKRSSLCVLFSRSARSPEVFISYFCVLFSIKIFNTWFVWRIKVWYIEYFNIKVFHCLVRCIKVFHAGFPATSDIKFVNSVHFFPSSVGVCFCA